MWMVDPKFMCDKHLLGEHCEIHMFIGAIRKGKRLDGFIKNNLLEIGSIYNRHDELAQEMLKRGFKHNSILPKLEGSDFKCLPKELTEAKIDRRKALLDLLKRCKYCRERYSKFR